MEGSEDAKLGDGERARGEDEGGKFNERRRTRREQGDSTHFVEKQQ